MPDRTNLRFGLEFGKGVWVNTAVTETLLIRNGGQGVLSITDASLSGPDAALFTILAGASGATVASGDIAVIQVQYRPQSAGASTATLTIHSNAANTPTLSIGLNASAVTSN